MVAGRLYPPRCLMAGSCRFLLISQPRREESQDLPAVLPEQPLHIQHTRPLLGRIPRRLRPPDALALGLQPELNQPEQAHRRPLGLTRPLDRLASPRPALLPA